jgi:hypothetical protein
VGEGEEVSRATPLEQRQAKLQRQHQRRLAALKSKGDEQKQSQAKELKNAEQTQTPKPEG